MSAIQICGAGRTNLCAQLLERFRGVASLKFAVMNLPHPNLSSSRARHMDDG